MLFFSHLLAHPHVLFRLFVFPYIPLFAPPYAAPHAFLYNHTIAPGRMTVMTHFNTVDWPLRLAGPVIHKVAFGSVWSEVCAVTVELGVAGFNLPHHILPVKPIKGR